MATEITLKVSIETLVAVRELSDKCSERGVFNEEAWESGLRAIGLPVDDMKGKQTALEIVQ